MWGYGRLGKRDPLYWKRQSESEWRDTRRVCIGRRRNLVDDEKLNYHWSYTNMENRSNSPRQVFEDAGRLCRLGAPTAETCIHVSQPRVISYCKYLMNCNLNLQKVSITNNIYGHVGKMHWVLIDVITAPRIWFLNFLWIRVGGRNPDNSILFKILEPFFFKSFVLLLICRVVTIESTSTDGATIFDEKRKRCSYHRVVMRDTDRQPWSIGTKLCKRTKVVLSNTRTWTTTGNGSRRGPKKF